MPKCKPSLSRKKLPCSAQNLLYFSERISIPVRICCLSIASREAISQRVGATFFELIECLFLPISVLNHFISSRFLVLIHE